MEIRNTKFTHELLLLGLYIIVSPFVFNLCFIGEIKGEGFIAYLIIFAITLLTSLISGIIIYFLKIFKNEFKLSLFLGIIPLLFSFFILFSFLSDGLAFI